MLSSAYINYPQSQHSRPNYLLLCSASLWRSAAGLRQSEQKDSRSGNRELAELVGCGSVVTWSRRLPPPVICQRPLYVRRLLVVKLLFKLSDPATPQRCLAADCVKRSRPCVTRSWFMAGKCWATLMDS